MSSPKFRFGNLHRRKVAADLVEKERFISTPEATFGILLAGRYGFFTQEPPLHLCVASGRYPVHETIEGGRTYAVADGQRSITIASRPTADTLHHLFLGFSLGMSGNGDGKQLVLRQVKGAFGRFLQRMDEVKDPEIVIRWLGE